VRDAETKLSGAIVRSAIRAVLVVGSCALVRQWLMSAFQDHVNPVEHEAAQAVL
jgi:hypothetical protein